MSATAFQGGVHLSYNKGLARDKPIKKASLPEELIIPLSQHTGAPCEPAVEVGDRVEAGQKVGDSEAFVSAPVHASLSGTVREIRPRLTFTGDRVESVVIDVDPKQQERELKPKRVSEKVTEKEIIGALREAGVVGMGGAAFPTAVKLSPPDDKPIDSIIINGCECEPYLTCDYRVMLERREELIGGAKLLLKVLGADKCYLSIEDNKPEAIKALKEVSDDPRLEVVSVPTKYPQGSEKQLIKTLLNREVPSGGLPFDVGALVQNVSTTVAIFEAVYYDKPLMERVVTVTGDNIKEPSNLLSKVGTPIYHLINECGGLIDKRSKVIMGGPMTGFAQPILQVPIVKGSNGLLLFSSSMVDEDQEFIACMRCGECVEDCPMRLYPSKISTAYEEGRIEDCEEWDALDCVECGVCSYVCPSRRPIVYHIKEAKSEIMAIRQKQEQAGEQA